MRRNRDFSLSMNVCVLEFIAEAGGGPGLGLRKRQRAKKPKIA